VEEVADVSLLERPEDLLTVRGVRLVAGRAEGRRERLGDAVEQLVGDVDELEEVVVDDPAYAVASAQETVDVPVPSGLGDDTDERLVNDGSRTAGLADDGVSFRGGHVGRSVGDRARMTSPRNPQSRQSRACRSSEDTGKTV